MSNLILPPNLFYTFHAECNYHDALQCFYRGNWALQGFERTPGGGGSDGEGEGWELGEKERELFRRRKEGAKSEILKMAGNRINKKKN